MLGDEFALLMLSAANISLTKWLTGAVVSVCLSSHYDFF